MRRLKRGLWFLFLLALTFVLISNVWVVMATYDKVVDDPQSLADNGMALVLGTSHKTVKGTPNPFFENRIETAAQLYRMGKVRHIIVSGDNRTRYYNEPLAMQKALLKKGVPDSVITLDYAGLRTLDSIVRSKEIFGQNNIIIITQPFHCYRALFISSFYDIDAVAVAAGEPEESIRVRTREYFARPMAVLDLYVFRTPPRFLGEKETINNPAGE